MTTLEQLIEQPAAVVEEHEPLARASQTMLELRVGSVCILDHEGALAGIFTERDLLRACAAGVDTHTATVGRWMTPEPVTANGSDDAGDALRIMIERDFRHLPVMGDGGLVGVVSLRQLSADLHQPA